ncbi:tetratricopeptide repeat protein, partial [Rhodothermus marinus]|uniref:tetratricopeptide repeat protein n=1 Tax=Rhodothermus marinus TaxID=29549 RepID=UPI001FB47299
KRSASTRRWSVAPRTKPARGALPPRGTVAAPGRPASGHRRAEPSAYLFPGYPEWLARGYLAQARAFLALGQRGEATRLYDLVISEFPNTSFARIAAQEKARL